MGHQFDKRAKSNVREKSGFIKKKTSISVHFTTSHDCWVIQKGKQSGLFLLSLLHLSCTISASAKMWMIYCSSPYCLVLTAALKPGLPFLREHLYFPQPSVKLASVPSCELGSLERSPMVTGSLAPGAALI